MQYGNYSHHAVPYIPMTCLFYNWNLYLWTPFIHFAHTPIHPLPPPLAFYLFSCSVWSSFGHWELFQWLQWLFELLASLCVWFISLFACSIWALSYFLVLQSTPGSSFVFPALMLKSAIFPKSSGLFYCRIVSETKIWALSMLLASGILLLVGPLSQQNKEICMCIYGEQIYSW